MDTNASNDGLYPPPSLQSLLRSYLTDCHRTAVAAMTESADKTADEAIDEATDEATAKHQITIYLLMDLATLLQGSHPAIDQLIKYPSAFRISPSLIKLTQAFWLLDHEDYRGFLDTMTGQLISDSDVKDWHHKLVLRTLVRDNRHKLALTYLRVRKPPLSTLEDRATVISLSVEYGLVQSAFLHHRPPSHYAHLLTCFFRACKTYGKLNDILHLALSPEEEEIFVRFLEEENEAMEAEGEEEEEKKEKEDDDDDDYEEEEDIDAVDTDVADDTRRLLYYLQRCRYVEAGNGNFSQRRVHRKVVESRKQLQIDATTLSTLEAYNATLPSIVKHFTVDMAKADLNADSRARYPRPMSYGGSRGKTLNLYEMAIKKARETYVRREGSHIPFVSAPCTSLKRFCEGNNAADAGCVLFPEPALRRRRNKKRTFRQTYEEDVDEEEADGASSPASGADPKRRRLALELELENDLGLAITNTPLVRRKTAVVPLGKDVFPGTPQSILKIRRSTRDSASPANGSVGAGDDGVESSFDDRGRRVGRQIRFESSKAEEANESKSNGGNAVEKEDVGVDSDVFLSPELTESGGGGSSGSCSSSGGHLPAENIHRPRPRPSLRRSFRRVSKSSSPERAALLSHDSAEGKLTPSRIDSSFSNASIYSSSVLFDSSFEPIPWDENTCSTHPREGTPAGGTNSGPHDPTVKEFEPSGGTLVLRRTEVSESVTRVQRTNVFCISDGSAEVPSDEQEGRKEEQIPLSSHGQTDENVEQAEVSKSAVAFAKSKHFTSEETDEAKNDEDDDDDASFESLPKSLESERSRTPLMHFDITDDETNDGVEDRATDQIENVNAQRRRPSHPCQATIVSVGSICDNSNITDDESNDTEVVKTSTKKSRAVEERKKRASSLLTPETPPIALRRSARIRTEGTSSPPSVISSPNGRASRRRANSLAKEVLVSSFARAIDGENKELSGSDDVKGDAPFLKRERSARRRSISLAKDLLVPAEAKSEAETKAETEARSAKCSPPPASPSSALRRSTRRTAEAGRKDVLPLSTRTSPEAAVAAASKVRKRRAGSLPKDAASVPAPRTRRAVSLAKETIFEERKAGEEETKNAETRKRRRGSSLPPQDGPSVSAPARRTRRAGSMAKEAILEENITKEPKTPLKGRATIPAEVGPTSSPAANTRSRRSSFRAEEDDENEERIFDPPRAKLSTQRGRAASTDLSSNRSKSRSRGTRSIAEDAIVEETLDEEERIFDPPRTVPPAGRQRRAASVDLPMNSFGSTTTTTATRTTRRRTRSVAEEVIDEESVEEPPVRRTTDVESKRGRATSAARKAPLRGKTIEPNESVVVSFAFSRPDDALDDHPPIDRAAIDKVPSYTFSPPQTRRRRDVAVAADAATATTTTTSPTNAVTTARERRTSSPAPSQPGIITVRTRSRTTFVIPRMPKK